MRTRSALLHVIPALGLMVSSCGPSALPGPRADTPAFYWAAANKAYRAGDYMQTSAHLDQISRSDNEFTARARVWQIVMTSGLARGYAELADYYEAGARTSRNNPMPFRRQVNALRVNAGNAAVQFAETFHQFSAAKDANVTLDFAFPGGSAPQPPGLKKVSAGILIPDAEFELLQKTMLQRGLLLSVSDAVGASNNSARVQEMFQNGAFHVSANVFRLAMAVQLHESAQVFGPDKLDQPNKVKLLCGEATEALNAVPASKQTKDLAAKIQKTLKKSRIS